MFDADIDALFDVSVSNSLVNYDANSRLCDVVDDTSFAVVDFVGHAVETLDIFDLGARKSVHEPLLDSAICFDVDYVTDPNNFSDRSQVDLMWQDLLVLPQICGELDVALLLEVARKRILKTNSAPPDSNQPKNSPACRREDQLRDP